MRYLVSPKRVVLFEISAEAISWSAVQMNLVVVSLAPTGQEVQT